MTPITAPTPSLDPAIRAAAGALWLDARYPRWANQIKDDKPIDVACGSTCPLEQILIGGFNGVEGKKLSASSLFALGFSAPAWHVPTADWLAACDLLTEAWGREVIYRQRARR